MKMDRTLIEQPSGSGGGGGATGGGGSSPSRKGPQPQPQQHGNSNASSNSDANPSPSRTTSWIDSLGSGEESSSHHQEMIMNDTQARGQHEEQKLGEKGGRLMTRGSGKGSTTSSIRGSGFPTKSPTNTTISDTKSTRLTSMDSSSGASPTNTAFNNTTQQQQQQSNPSQQQQHQQQGGPQTTTTSFRRLNDFLFEDPAVYTQSEIRDILDMINDGNKVVGGGGGGGYGGEQQQQQQQHGIGDDGGVGGNAGTSSGIGGGSGGNNDDRGGTTTTSHLRAAGNGQGLKPVCKAYGILGFIRFLDCYYLTLITKRAKVGSIGGNSIYTIKVRRRR